MVWLIRLDAGKREDGDEEDKGEGLQEEGRSRMAILIYLHIATPVHVSDGICHPIRTDRPVEALFKVGRFCELRLRNLQVRSFNGGLGLPLRL